MFRCIVESPVAVAIKGVPHVISRNLEDQPADSPLVAAAPWAFEELEDLEEPEGDDAPKRNRPRQRRAATRRPNDDA